MTMSVRVSLYSILRERRFAQADVDIPEGATVSDVLSKIELPQNDVGIVMVNARCGTFQQNLNKGDRLTLLPNLGGG